MAVIRQNKKVLVLWSFGFDFLKTVVDTVRIIWNPSDELVLHSDKYAVRTVNTHNGEYRFREKKTTKKSKYIKQEGQDDPISLTWMRFRSLCNC